MGYFTPQNPGIGGTDELTASEEVVVQTITALGDPNADRILFWDDSIGQYQHLSAGSGLSIAGTTITATGTGEVWSEVTGTSQAAAVNYAYITNNAGLVTVTLPDTAAVGDTLRIVGKGAGGWAIAQNASENINFGNITTTTGVGGSLASTHRYDCIHLVCTVANTTWTVMNVQGNITYV